MQSGERHESNMMEASIRLLGNAAENDVEKSALGHRYLKRDVVNGRKLETGWYFIDEKEGEKRILDRTSTVYFVNPEKIIPAKNIHWVGIEINHIGRWILVMKFDSLGTRLWADATTRGVGKKVGFIFNDHLLYAPEIASPILMGVAAVDNEFYTKAELEALKEAIKNK
jgi:preprotein translocase subunit SecD